MEAC
jgi:hypothetical protein